MLGHVVVRVRDLKRSLDFYTPTLGFGVSDVCGEDMIPGGMVVLRCDADQLYPASGRPTQSNTMAYARNRSRSMPAALKR